jgi:hypothetical protein
MRRYIPAILVVLGLAALTASAADDYWVKKDWHKWSKDEVKKMLQDSPWSRPIIESQPEITDALPHNSGAASNGSAGEDRPELDYYLELRSALPVREAYIRQQEMLQNYDKMSEDERKAFDQKSDDYLKKTFDQEIVLHVVYDSNVQTFLRSMMHSWQTMSDTVVPAGLFLINERGEHELAARWESPKSGVSEFELIFPRLQNGEPFIRDSDKGFSVNFPEPPVGGSGAGSFGGGHAVAQFKLDKMKIDGKVVF